MDEIDYSRYLLTGLQGQQRSRNRKNHVMDFEVKIFNDIWETEKKAPIRQLRKMNIKNISNRLDIVMISVIVIYYRFDIIYIINVKSVGTSFGKFFLLKKEKEIN